MALELENMLEGLQMAAGILAEGLADMTVERWPGGPERALRAAAMAHRAEDATILAKACEVLVRRAAELEL